MVRATLICTSIAAAATTAVPAVAVGAIRAHARPFAARVASVDGPLELTLSGASGRHLRVRLADVDAPLRAECGADVSRRALARLAPRGSRVLVTAQGTSKHGRRLVGLRRLRRSSQDGRDVALSLIERGGARGDSPWSIDAVGVPRAVHVLVPQTSYVYPLYAAAYRSIDPARKNAGVWGACQHRFHARTTPAAAPAPAPWDIDATGVLRTIGSLTLSATDTPAGGTRLSDVASAFPDLEISRDQEGTCTAYSAAAAASFVGLAGDGGPVSVDRRPCRRQLLSGVLSTGAIAPSRGPGIGGSEEGLSAFGIPDLTSHDSGRVPLNTDAAPPHWASTAQVSHGTIVGYLAERTPDSSSTS